MGKAKTPCSYKGNT